MAERDTERRPASRREAERRPALAGMRVLHAAAPGDAGGLERVVQDLAAAQAEGGREVHVAAVLDRGRSDHPFLAPFEDTEVVVHPREFRPRAYLAEARFLWGLCRRLAPDVVHTHGYRADVVAGATARRAGVPTVTTVHGFTGGGPKNRLYEWLQRRAFRRCDAVVAVSRPLARALEEDGVRPQRLHVVQNAWRPRGGSLDRAAARERLGMRPDATVLGWVGRLSPEKAPDLFLEALARLDADVRGSVVGDGRERPELEARAESLGLTGRVHWHGRVDAAHRLFRAFDVFVLSSRTEGTPMTLFEAMEAEVPIVATAVGGVPDVLGEDEARLVPPGDPAALAAAVRETLADRDAAAERASRARRRLRTRFATEEWVASYDRVYDAARGTS